MRGSRHLLAALLALAACGGGDDPGTTPTTPAPTTAAASRNDVGQALKDAAIAAETYYSDTGRYDFDEGDLATQGFTAPPGVTVTVVSASGTEYCLSAAGGGVTLYYSTTSGNVSEQPCS